MAIVCLKCKKVLERREEYCKNCYSLEILKGQCLNIAMQFVKNNLDGEQGTLSERLFKCAKYLFEEAKKQKVLEW